MKRYYSHKRREICLFLEGDIFEIDGQEYELKEIYRNGNYCLEPVIFRADSFIVTSGMNKIYTYSELTQFKHVGNSYSIFQ
jgi:hypothetical protein